MFRFNQILMSALTAVLATSVFIQDSKAQLPPERAVVNTEGVAIVGTACPIAGSTFTYLEIRNGYLHFYWHCRTGPTCSTACHPGRGVDDYGCFAPGTQILMGDKSTKAVEDLAKGDEVWNPALGHPVKIRETMAGPEKLALVEIGFDGKSIKVTRDHPMVVKSSATTFSPVSLNSEQDSAASSLGRVVKAAEVSSNDLVLGSDGKFHQISVLRELPIDPKQSVYNFEVEAPAAGSLQNRLVVANGIITGDLRVQTNLAGGQRPSFLGTNWS